MLKDQNQTEYAIHQPSMNDDLVDREEDPLSSIIHPSHAFSASSEHDCFNYGDILAQSSDANAAPWNAHTVGVEYDESPTVLSDMALRPHMPHTYTMSERHSLDEQSAKDSGYASIRMDLGWCVTCWEEKGVAKYFKNNADKT